MQKLTKKEVEIVSKLIKFKIRTESPFNLSKSDEKIRKQMIDFFFEEVIKDIKSGAYVVDLDKAQTDSFINKLNKPNEIMNMSDVYKTIPEYPFVVRKSKKSAITTTPPPNETA